MSEPVRIVVVSHSAALAEGVVALAAQMAPDVDLVAAGGTEGGGLGTSFDRIAAALDAPPDGGIVVLYDLGSALLSTETAIEFLDPQAAGAIDVADAPLVEGALAAASAAQGGADRSGVVAAARGAGQDFGPGAAPEGEPTSDDVTADVVLRNPLGLHARPAADLSRALSGLDAHVRVGRSDGSSADVTSVLSVVRFALRGGTEVRVGARGPDARQAVDRAIELIDGGFGEAGDAPAPDSATTDVAAGDSPRPGAPGRAIGPLLRAAAGSVPLSGDVADVAAERSRLSAAITRAAAELRVGDAVARMHAELLGDAALSGAAAAGVDPHNDAACAWWLAVQQSADSLAAEPDELVAGRAADVREAGAAVLRELGVPAARLPEDVGGRVLAVGDIGPAELGEFAARGGAALVLAGGTPTAHAVIVARGLGLPVVLQAGGLLDGVADGTIVAVDGSTGTVDVDPPDAVAREQDIAAAARRRDDELATAAAPVVVHGQPVRVGANIGSVADAHAAVRFGADGVGLLRTELLVLDRAELPDEDTQVNDLREILAVLAPRPVTVRVLDPGGDKPVRALHLDPQHNGFLGVRGLRWLLANPGVLHTQLRAVCRAAHDHRTGGGDLAVMAPMVTVAAEMQAFCNAVDAALDSLAADDVPHTRPDRIGAMIEVPAAALAADEIAEHADFLSVGTNDLTAYTMAADRTEPGVAALLRVPTTALWRLLEIVADRARGHAELGVCGELAAVPEHAERLVRLGFTSLSAAPAAIPGLKAHLRSC